jgi:hypothetical protein
LNLWWNTSYFAVLPLPQPRIIFPLHMN